MSIKYIFLFVGCFLWSEISAQVINDICADALPITIGTTCNGGTNKEAETDSSDDCAENTVSDVWFYYNATTTTAVSIKVNLEGQDSLFNDVLSVYSGNCNSLTQLTCTNYDEYGFEGEKVYFDAIAGQTYYVKVSAQEKNFGNSRGDFCLVTAQQSDPAISPMNDLCNTAEFLPINQDWLSASNNYANTEDVFADELQRNRADVWYEFVPEFGANVNISTTANFSHTLALYSGDCSNLTLVKKDLQGFELQATDLISDESYYVQISGRFATLEGDFQIKIEDNSSIAVPPNDLCASAIPIEPNGECMAFDNTNGTFSGIRPSCSFYPGADVWYQYTAPLDGTTDLKINTAADFMHNVAIYEGGCADTLEIMCSLTPDPCEGYLRLVNLTPGQTYFIQVISNLSLFADVAGTGCLEIIRIEQGDNFLPLSLEVSQICNDEESASLYLDIAGGQGEYTVMGFSAGAVYAEGDSYFIQVIDEVGCTQVATGTITCESDNECGLFHNVSVMDVNCNGLAEGDAYVFSLPTNPDITTTYLWDNGSVDAHRPNLAPGEYNVTITSIVNETGELCDETVLEVEIEAPPILNVSYVTRPASSETDTDGSATIIPTGGTPPYTYQWWAGQESTQTLTNLAPSHYSFTVFDVYGCSASGTAQVGVDTFCVEQRILTDIINAGTTEILAASDIIVSSSFIAPQANIEYMAGNKIRLTSGFRAATGSDFHAHIEDCSAGEDFVTIAAKTFLAGAFDAATGMMRDDLRTANMLPLIEPYTDLGYEMIHSGGEAVEPDVFTLSGATAVVDWIYLELRDRIDPSIVLAARPALLCRNGDIVDIDGMSAVTFMGIETGDYYVAIKHRNHLGVMTAAALNLGELPKSIDFTSTNTPVWGDNACHSQNDINRMWCGDMNGDGQIIYQGAASDLLSVTTNVYSNTANTEFQASYPAPGYSVSDSNLDGQTIYQGAASDLLPVTISVYSNPANAEFQASFPVFEQLPE